VHDIPLE
jgi:hypothetical protein